MRGLTESLLELARVDAGASKIPMAELDYSSLVCESLMLFEPLYFEKERELTGQVEENVRIKGSSSHLRQVTEILLDNALKYSYPHSGTQVTLRQQGRHCLLTVSNPGEALAQEDLKNIFKRFYRVDEARRMNHSYGLGLPIAEGIVRSHCGKIWAESAGGVNHFFVQLPL